MDDEERNLVKAVSSHDRREQKREARDAVGAQKEQEMTSKEKRSQYFWLGLTLIGLVAVGSGIGYLMTHKPTTYTDRQVHWHGLVDISICGQHKDLPRSKGGSQVHGKSYVGVPLMHTHDDNTLHIEGLIQKKEDIVLGLFFDVIEVPFDKDRIMDVKNGDLCDGKPGVLKMYVNDQPRTDFRDYVPVAVEDARKQVIKLVFEPEASANNT